MVMGMDYHSFWYEDPNLINAYLRKDRLAREIREAEYEYEAWLAGSYVYEAVAVVLEHAFAKHAKSSYPAKPRETPSQYTKRKKLERETGVVQADPKVALFQAQFDVWAKNFARSLDKGSR